MKIKPTITHFLLRTAQWYLAYRWVHTYHSLGIPALEDHARQQDNEAELGLAIPNLKMKSWKLEQSQSYVALLSYYRAWYTYTLRYREAKAGKTFKFVC